MTSNPLRIMVVDDSVVYRKLIARVAGALPGVEISAVAATGKIALAKLQQTPIDVLLYEVNLPDIDGFELLKTLQQSYPSLSVIMISTLNEVSTELSVRALQKGVLDFIPKPDANDDPAAEQVLLHRLKLLFRQIQSSHHLREMRTCCAPPVRIEKKVIPRSAKPIEAPRKPMIQISSLPSKIDLVAIGVSTGGPNALSAVVPLLPGDLRVPVLVVQHMPPNFTTSLAQSLDRRSQLQVREAQPNDEIKPGTVLIAAGGKHIVVKQFDGEPWMRVGLNEAPLVHGCRPSVDMLFASVAQVFQGSVLAVIMTGMGEDGAEGVRLLKHNKCYCITQSEETCVVYGMPRMVYERGLSQEQVPLDQIAIRIMQLVKDGACV